MLTSFDVSCPAVRRLSMPRTVLTMGVAVATHFGPGVSVVVRTRRTNDLDACLTLLRRVHVADGYPRSWPRDPAGWLTGESELAAWVAEINGRIAGHASLSSIDMSNAWPAWRVMGGPLAALSRFFVDPDERGLGIGGALLDEVDEHRSAGGLTGVLEVAAQSVAATEVYRQRGWRCVGQAMRVGSEDRLPLPVLLFVAPDHRSRDGGT